MPTKLHTSKWLWWCILCYTYFTVIFFKELSKIKASAKEKRKLSKSFSLLCKENMKSLPRSTNPNTLWPLDTSLISPHPPSAPHFPLTALHSHTSLVFTPQGCDLTSEAPNPPGILFPQLFKWIVPFRPLGHLLWEAPPPHPIQVSRVSLVTFGHITLPISFERFWSETILFTRLLPVPNLLMDMLRRVRTLSALFSVIAPRD